MKNLIVVMMLLLLCVSIAHADKNRYITYGQDTTITRGITSLLRIPLANPYSAITPNPTNGSRFEPIVEDFNNDTNPDIILPSSNGKTYAINGKFPSGIESFVSTGIPQSPGVVCSEFLNDGGAKAKYVGIYNTSGGTFLEVLNMTDSGQLGIQDAISINPVNVSSNIVCGRIYANNGDTKRYAFWLDNTKQLFRAYYNDAKVLTVEPVAVLDAVTEEASNPIGADQGSHNVIGQTSFDPDGNTAIIFIAGNKLYAYLSDNTSYSVDYSGDGSFSGYNPPSSVKGVRLSGGILQGPGSSTTAVAALFDGDTIALTGQTGNNPLLLFEMTDSFFFGKSIDIVRSTTVGCSGTETTTGQYCSSKMASSDINNDGMTDIYTFNTVYGSPVFSALRRGNIQVVSLSKNTTSVVNTLSPVSSTAGSTDEVVFDRRIFLIDANGDGQKDLVYTYGAEEQTSIILGPSFTTNYRTLGNSSSTGEGNENTPIPVDVNNDGILDFLYINNGNNLFYVSGVQPTTANTYPFSVENNNTIGLESTAKITAKFNNTNTVYRYAVSCDIGTSSVWTEKFGFGYNFTQRNVSFNVVPPEDFLEFNDFKFSINTTFPQFDMLKEHTVGVRDYSEMHVQYTITGNNTMDLIVYDDNNQVTDYLRFNKTGNEVGVNKVFIGFTSEATPLNTTTVVGGYLDIKITYIPTTDFGSGQLYYKQIIVINNETLVTTDSIGTAPFTGSNIKNSELFSDSPSTIKLYLWSLSLTHNPFPAFVQFQNGQRLTEGDVTVDNPAPESPIAGEGYTVYPDVNDVFYSSCSYSQPGTYTQRHFIAPLNNDDWTNPKELRVTVSIGSNSTGTGATGANGGDTFTGGANDFFSFLGITSTGGKFAVWLLISFIFAIIIFLITKNNVVFGLIALVSALVVGFFISAVPLWVIILLVLLAGGIAAIAYRVFFAGG